MFSSPSSLTPNPLILDLLHPLQIATISYNEIDSMIVCLTSNEYFHFKTVTLTSEVIAILDLNLEEALLLEIASLQKEIVAKAIFVNHEREGTFTFYG